MTVVVPDGLRPGDEFLVSAHGGEFTVTVPDGVYGGAAIDLDLPLPEGHCACSSSESAFVQQVVVTVPDGATSGQAFVVEFDGQEFEVIVPAGLRPGDELEIELPTRGAPSPPVPPPPPTAAQGGVGWDDWDCAWEAPPKGSAPWAEAPEPAPYYGRYKIGEKVQVQRTSGAWSPAVIKEYDELSDTYTIELIVSKQRACRLAGRAPGLPHARRLRARASDRPPPRARGSQVHALGE